ncbi:MAG: hypothetical protein OXK78_12325 [Caldilineaceae bacterium]|nr:hypothetical protein [Caldilineaceae bacterium]
MAKDRADTSAQHASILTEKFQLQRQPDKSEKAHEVRIAKG